MRQTTTDQATGRPFRLELNKPVNDGYKLINMGTNKLIGYIHRSNDTRRIVQAVNAHDQLVQAVRELLPYVHAGYVDDNSLPALSNASGAILRAKQALAKAGTV